MRCQICGEEIEEGVQPCIFCGGINNGKKKSINEAIYDSDFIAFKLKNEYDEEEKCNEFKDEAILQNNINEKVWQEDLDNEEVINNDKENVAYPGSQIISVSIKILSGILIIRTIVSFL